jgi:hypothetical protein
VPLLSSFFECMNLQINFKKSSDIADVSGIELLSN